MKEQLVEMTQLSPRVIRVWFQNKRCKDKKKAILMKQMQQQEKVRYYSEVKQFLVISTDRSVFIHLLNSYTYIYLKYNFSTTIFLKFFLFFVELMYI
jgi:hypothetical protein